MKAGDRVVRKNSDLVIKGTIIEVRPENDFCYRFIKVDKDSLNLIVVLWDNGTRSILAPLSLEIL